MRAYSLSELFTLTRAELFALHAEIVAELATLPDTDRATALENLRRVRRVLGREAALICSPGTYDQKHIDRIGHLRAG